MTRQKALACGSKRYLGKVCDKHPRLKGERYTSSKRCVECHLASQSTPEARALQRKRQGTPEFRARYKSPEYRAYKRTYISNRRKTNVWFRASQAIRSCIGMSLRQHGAAKSRHTHELIGCSIKFFIKYLTVLMSYEGWTWEDHGKKWHIDHIRPMASFDLTDPGQQRVCCHYTNLEPIGIIENRRKSNVWDGHRWSRGKCIKTLEPV